MLLRGPLFRGTSYADILESNLVERQVEVVEKRLGSGYVSDDERSSPVPVVDNPSAPESSHLIRSVVPDGRTSIDSICGAHRGKESVQASESSVHGGLEGLPVAKLTARYRLASVLSELLT